MQRVSDERGAVAVIVAICAVLVFGLAAFVIDSSALYQERRELQNGADAAALAIAQDCVEAIQASPLLGNAACLGHNLDHSEAQRYANANALEGPTCGDAAADDCANVDDVDVDLVEHSVSVKTSTRDQGDGASSISYVFASVFGKSGKQVKAEARAVWGAPSNMPSIPLAIDQCEATSVPPGPSNEIVLVFHSGSDGDEDSSPCTSGSAGQDLPGGFGWLDTPGEDCVASVNEDGEAGADTGSDVQSTGCEPEHFAIGSTIALPVYETAEANGNTGVYGITGYVGFTITGYRFLGNNPDWKAPASNPPCTPSKACLRGYFTTLIVHEGELGGTDFGTTLIRLTTPEETEI